TLATSQVGSADDCGGNDSQFLSSTQIGGNAREIAVLDQTRDSCDQRGQDINSDFQSVYTKTGQPGRSFIPSNSIHIAPPNGPRKKDPKENSDYAEDDRWIWDPENIATTDRQK